MNSTGLTWKLWLFPLLGYLSVTLFEFMALALSPLLQGGLQVQDVPPTTAPPRTDVGEWRDQSRPGYRAQPTTSLVALYRYIMDKAGRGEEINTIETLLIRSAIANRTWPEAPEITFRHQALQQWILQQPENGRLFTDPDGWLRGRLSDASFEQLVEAGLTDQDTPHTQASERFRVFWTGLTPEQREALPVGDWMRRYYVRLGFDMRSDEQRNRDEAFVKKQEALREAGLKHQADAERQLKEAAEAAERQRQKWFNDNWAEEDRRIAREQAERDLIWGEFVAFFMKLSPEERARTLQEMTVEQREELDLRLPPEAAGAEPSKPAVIGSDAAVAKVRLPVGHHAKPPETDLSTEGTSGAAVVAEAAKTEADRIAAMHSFRVVTPSIWAGASDKRSFYAKRQSAEGVAIHQMCPYQATVYAEANGKVDPAFAPKTIDEIRVKLDSEAVEHRKWGREPEIRPFAIGPFKGFLLETRLRFVRGGWSHSGYRDSKTEAIGHGWVTLDGRTFEVSYSIGSAGCWDNSQRPFQESQSQAALREAQAILAGLRLVAEPSVTQVPYTGPKLDGSDLPEVRLEPAELPRLNPGETVIVRARVETLSADDRPLRFEWTGEHEGDGSEVLIRATQPGTYSLAVTVEGAQYALGSASLNYDVSALQVRAERLAPYATGPVPVGTKIPLRASLTEEGHPATGDYIYRWQPDPEVRFEKQDDPTETVTASFLEPGQYLLWVQVLRRQGEVLSTVIQSEQLEIVVESQTVSSGDPVDITGTKPKATASKPKATGGSGDPVDITGVWQHGTGDETWTFTPNPDGTYTAVETGFGNARGNATVSGNKSHIDYQTSEGVSGKYNIVFDSDGQTGRGTWTSDLPDSGSRTFTKKTPISTSTPSQPTAPQDPNLESSAITQSDKSKTDTYSWKLVKVIDFENQAGWTMPESENWQFKAQYARGDFTVTVFNKADKSFKYGARAIWSSPPLVMKPGQKIALTANLAETENTHHSNSSGALASADLAPPDHGWGSRGDVKFLTADGEEGVSINGAHQASASDTFSAVAPVGKEGDQFALRLSFYMGAIMGTSYVYEWVPGDLLDVTGVWQHGTGDETWTFTPNPDGTYIAVETGFGNARGKATVSGNKIHIDYQTPEGVSGEYDIVVDADGQTGRGTWTSDLPDSGSRTFTKQTLIATNTPSQPTAPADSNAFTIRVGEHRLKQGETAAIAVEVLNPGEVSNLNVVLEFDSNVVQVQAKPTIGQVAGQRLFEANYSQSGSIRLGFAGSARITQEGTLAIVPFVASGTPGSSTPIKVQVTQANRADGQRMEPQVISGSIAIVAVDVKPPAIQPSTTLPPITPPASPLTTEDALKALRMSVKLLPEDLRLDVDKNGQVTSNDARIILKRVTKRE
jgi:hypothetical protein